MLMANLSRDVRAIAFATRTVVLADWMFTTPAIIVKPVTGYVLMKIAGLPVATPWLFAAIALYLFAGACWLPVVWMQICMKKLAAEAVATGTDLPLDYWRYNRWWLFWVVWPSRPWWR